MSTVTPGSPPTSTRGPRLTGPERREQLLDTTLELVTREGFHAVTIDAVARAAGITRPVVYGHFTDLGGLLHALVDRESALALEQLDTVVPGALEPAPARELAVRALTAFLEAVATAPVRWRLVLMPLEGSPRVLQDRVAANRGQVCRQLEELIAAALARDGFDVPIDVPLVAHAAQDYAEGAARLVLTDPEEFPVERIVRAADLALALTLER